MRDGRPADLFLGLLQQVGVVLRLHLELVAHGDGGEVAEAGDVDDGEGVEGEDRLVGQPELGRKSGFLFRSCSACGRPARPTAR